MAINGGAWTVARFNSFITSALRNAHGKWGPKHKAKKKAWVSHGKYKCAMCNTIGPATLPPIKVDGKRRNNACVDHIEPVVDPEVGKESWDIYIERMFVELDDYQVLCWDCHTKKSKEERDVATARKRRLKNQGS